MTGQNREKGKGERGRGLYLSPVYKSYPHKLETNTDDEKSPQKFLEINSDKIFNY